MPRFLNSDRSTRSVPPIVRKAWRRLISMRTALVLLFLLALAAVPGSLLPQRPLNPAKVQSYLDTHGAWGRFLNSIGAFDVFGSFWFAAVYLLLFVSLIGCLVPRIKVYARALRAKPLKAPRHLDRLAENHRITSRLAPDEAAALVRSQLRPRWRTVVRTEDATGTRPAAVTVSAEKGYSREAGNLLFHLSLLAALVLIALGRLYSYEGSTVVTEGEGFCNPGLYDSYRSGSWVQVGSTKKFCVDELNKFTATYRDDGTPSQFKADVTYSEGIDGVLKHDSITVNHPLRLQGDRVYLINHGFSPTVTITRPGHQPVTSSNPFLPQDGFLTSEGVVLLTGTKADGSADDIGIQGLFAPTPQDNGGVITSIGPQPNNPVLAIFAFKGDSQLGTGLPRSVYSLDTSKMTKVGAKNLSVGQSMKLPDGTTVRFDGYKQWATLQVSHDPTQGYLLIAAILMVAGLLGSLVVRRRRVWLRLTSVAADRADLGDSAGSVAVGSVAVGSVAVGSDAGVDDSVRSRTLIAVGGLARNDSGEFAAEFAALVAALNAALNVDTSAVDHRSAAVAAGVGRD
jgi:cytochrome c biogenesis protein